MRTRLAITVLAALAAMFGLAGLANAATTPAPQHVAVQGTLIVPDGPGHAHSLAIPAGADAVARPDGLVCIAHPINACGFVFSKSLTETIYTYAIKNGVNAAAAFCVSQLNAHGFGWLSFVCNAAADYVKKLTDPRGSCLFVGAAGITPIAVYTHDSCF
ncbi:hypothetical protein [Kutzneria buriramensis]|uniref:Subtilisin inhibitor-like n=1 Tax=Kutzneria buriramensis TaxID=1045776 RepID=A0A3E0HET0_9PSEU|nr:hypothetical protein [Kutzneria buriramensis]REH43673.1 hypothetical protein BCF44_109216 [Kutzneria buriramensis]